MQIPEKYSTLGGAGGSLGSPIGPQITTPDGIGASRQYEHGSIYWSPATGAHALHRELDAAYRRRSATAGPLGYPIADDSSLPRAHGPWALFQHGALRIDGGHDEVLSGRHDATIRAYTLPVVGAHGTGVHLSWVGPRSWTYSAAGYWIQRRIAPQSPPKLSRCVELVEAALSAARRSGQSAVALGPVLVRHGTWPYPHGGKCDVITLELDTPVDEVEVTVEGSPANGFLFALRDGKVTAGPLHAASGVLRAPGIDTVVAYAQGAKAMRWCVRDEAARAADEAAWARVPYLVEHLQLPLATLDPAIANERALAASRVPAGTLADADIARLLDALRASLPPLEGPRPIDQIALWRDGTGVAGSSEESAALDPLRVALLDPLWRRALGMALFDDKDVVPGATYEYRITGVFPVEDLDDRIYGFHTVPTTTPVPVDFYLDDLRVTLAEPSRIVRVKTGVPTAVGSRRGLAFARWRGVFAWHGDLADPLAGASLKLAFSTPVTEVILELASADGLAYAAFATDRAVGARVPLPSARARLAFATAIDELRLYGTGVLLSVRIPGGAEGLVPVSVTLPPVRLVDTPLPPPPRRAIVQNLQSAASPPAPGSTPPEVPAPRHMLGFDVRWLPPQLGDAWPHDEPAAAPLAATMYELQHGDESGTTWQSVIDGGWIIGSRPGATPEPVAITCDLMRRYPEERAPQPVSWLSWRDTFSPDLPKRPAPRPAPPPGTKHRYRIRSIDAVGRASATWTETTALRLEKHVPPPQPAAWADPKAPVPSATTPRHTGVFATVLQAGTQELADELAAATDLTAAERAALASMAGNAVILRWGWHDDQRALDPHAREFRLYATPPLDVSPGQLVRWEAHTGGWRLHLVLERAVEADAAAGLDLVAGYPFHIVSHPAGTEIAVDVTVAIPNADGSLPAPVAGPIRLPLRHTAAMMRPSRWRDRVAVVPITGDTQYHHIFFDLLSLSESHPHDVMWVGVSAADDQEYVSDQRTTGVTRNGNESAIVAATCSAKYARRPVVAYVPPLGDVEVVTAPQPAGRPVIAELELATGLPAGTFAAGELTMPERVSAGDVVGAYAVSGDELRAGVAARREGEPADVAIADFATLAATDRDALAAIFGAGDIEDVDGKYLVWLAAHHPYADRLFKPVLHEPQAGTRLVDTLPPTGGRWIYRLRKASAAGQLSAGAAYPPLIVRVPSPRPGAVPEREEVTAEPTGVRLRLRAPRAGLSHLLLFTRELRADAPPVGEVLRIPNRPDLFPDHVDRMILLRTDDGLLSPTVKALSDPDVTVGDDGLYHADLHVTGVPGQVLQAWACSLTRDLVPSRLVGPFRLTIPGAAHG